jgi:hypothetical protein
MLEETIKELCRLTKIPAETLSLCNITDAHFKNKEFLLQHYKAAELEWISISHINEEDIEIDIITYTSDSSYLMEIRIKTECLAEARKFAERIKRDNKVFQRAKKCMAEKAFPCENPYEIQVMIPIDCAEQKDAAGFAYSLLNAYISDVISKRKKEEKARKKLGMEYDAIF